MGLCVAFSGTAGRGQGLVTKRVLCPCSSPATGPPGGTCGPSYRVPSVPVRGHLPMSVSLEVPWS